MKLTTVGQFHHHYMSIICATRCELIFLEISVDHNFNVCALVELGAILLVKLNGSFCAKLYVCRKKCSSRQTVEKFEFRGQFHQHFTRVKVSPADFFALAFKVFTFFGAKILAEKLFLKYW